MDIEQMKAAVIAAEALADAASKLEQMASHITVALSIHHGTTPDGFNDMAHATSRALAAYREATS